MKFAFRNAEVQSRITGNKYERSGFRDISINRGNIWFSVEYTLSLRIHRLQSVKDKDKGEGEISFLLQVRNKV